MKKSEVIQQWCCHCDRWRRLSICCPWSSSYPKPAHHQVSPSYKLQHNSSSHPGQTIYGLPLLPFLSIPHSTPWQILMSLLAKGIQTLTTSHHLHRCFPVWITIIFLWVVAGKDWGQEEKGEAEDQMVGWHHQLKGHEFEQSPGNGEGQGKPGVLQFMGPQSQTQLSGWTAVTILLHSLYLTFFVFVILIHFNNDKCLWDICVFYSVPFYSTLFHSSFITGSQ